MVGIFPSVCAEAEKLDSGGPGPGYGHGGRPGSVTWGRSQHAPRRRRGPSPSGTYRTLSPMPLVKINQVLILICFRGSQIV